VSCSFEDIVSTLYDTGGCRFLDEKDGYFARAKNEAVWPAKHAKRRERETPSTKHQAPGRKEPQRSQRKRNRTQRRRERGGTQRRRFPLLCASLRPLRLCVEAVNPFALQCVRILAHCKESDGSCSTAETRNTQRMKARDVLSVLRDSAVQLVLLLGCGSAALRSFAANSSPGKQEVSRL
jgi:hypothetical protein